MDKLHVVTSPFSWVSIARFTLLQHHIVLQAYLLRFPSIRPRVSPILGGLYERSIVWRQCCQGHSQSEPATRPVSVLHTNMRGAVL